MGEHLTWEAGGGDDVMCSEEGKIWRHLAWPGGFLLHFYWFGGQLNGCERDEGRGNWELFFWVYFLSFLDTVHFFHVLLDDENWECGNVL